MTNPKDIVIVSAKRTAIGSFQGSLSSISASELGSVVIKAILNETGIDPNIIDEVIIPVELFENKQGIEIGKFRPFQSRPYKI